MSLSFKESAVQFKNIQSFCFYLTVFASLLFLDIYLKSDISFLYVFLIISLLLSCVRSLRHASYTYWAFSLTSLIFVTYFTLFFSGALSVLQFLGVLLVGVSLLGLTISVYTPIVYPIAYWWEYDFRFRHDVEGHLVIEGTGCYDSRLTDLRGKSGSFHAFRDIGLGTRVGFTFLLNDNRIFAKGEVVSVRENSLGRGRYYGVKFVDCEGFSILKGFWKSSKVHKKTLKKRSLKNEQKSS